MTSTSKNSYDFTLDTQDGYFDQVVSLPQGVINESFKALFDQVPKSAVDRVPDVAKIYLDREDNSQLNCILAAPTVLLLGNTTNTTGAYYQLRIKNGTARLPSERILRLDGWVISVKVDLSEVALTDHKDLDKLSKTYDGFVAGDYRVQRIFCALASANWRDPEPSMSTCGLDPVTKEPIAYADWSRKHETDAEQLVTLLAAWARKQKSTGLTSLGIKFELDEDKTNALEPTFRPVHVFAQVYPYFSVEHPGGFNGVGSYSEGGTPSAGDCNCLAFCENVDSSWQLYSGDGPADGGLVTMKARQLPLQRKLGHTGNLAKPTAAGGGTTKIIGSFVMDHRVWLEYFLLPQFQQFCTATQMHVGDSLRSWNEAECRPQLVPQYAIGCQLPGDTPVRDSNHGAFRFEKRGDSWYKWEQSSSNEGKPARYTLDIAFTTIDLSWNTYAASSSSEVEVTWIPGGDFLDVKGCITYSFETKFASNKEMTDVVSHRKYKLRGTWAVKVTLISPGKRVLDLELGGLGFDVLTDEDVNSNVTGNAKKVFEEALRKSLERCIENVTEIVKNRFAQSGKFVFPGHGELEFTNPKLTKSGNIITDISYVLPSGPNHTIQFPKQGDVAPLEPLQPVSSVSQFPDEYVDSGRPKLHWKMDFAYNAEKKMGRLALTATNEAMVDGVVLKYIKITLVPPRGTNRCLFNGAKWGKENKTMLEHAESLFRTAKNALSSLFLPRDFDDDNNDVGETKDHDTAAAATDYSGNAYSFSESWQDGDRENVSLSVKLNKASFAVEALVKAAPRVDASGDGDEEPVFSVAHNESFTVVLQGRIDDGAAKWPIRVHESWQPDEDGEENNGQTGMPVTACDDWKMVEMFADGRRPDYFDVSEREEQLRAKGKLPKN